MSRKILIFTKNFQNRFIQFQYLSVLLMGMLLLLGSSISLADPITLPHQFVNGAIADADQVNENFTVLLNKINEQAVTISAQAAQIDQLNQQKHEFAYIKETTPSGNNSPGSTASLVWRKRLLNVAEGDNFVTLDPNTHQFTLPAGRYRIFASIPMFQASSHSSRLWNVTENNLALQGTQEYIRSVVEGQTRSFVSGMLNLQESNTFELHSVVQDGHSQGMGQPYQFFPYQIWSFIEIEKLP